MSGTAGGENTPPVKGNCASRKLGSAFEKKTPDSIPGHFSSICSPLNSYFSPEIPA